MDNREQFLNGKIGLVPSVKLFQQRIENNNIVEKQIGNTLITFNDSNYGSSDIVGLNNVEIKFGQGFISCEVEFPLSPKMLFEAQSNQHSGDLYELFSIANYWTVKFGWGGQPEQVISRMRMVKWDITYDSNKRFFMAKLRLVPANGLILGDIKMRMLKRTNATIKDACDKEAQKGKKKGINLSLGRIITDVLIECREIVEKNKPLSEKDIDKFNTENKYVTNPHIIKPQIPPTQQTSKISYDYTPSVDIITPVAGSISSLSYFDKISYIRSELLTNIPSFSIDDANAAIANLLAENSTLDPTVENASKSAAYGIVQWVGSRKENLFKMFGSANHQPTFQEQVKFMIYELTNSHKRVVTNMSKRSTLASKVVAFERWYESSGNQINENTPEGVISVYRIIEKKGDPNVWGTNIIKRYQNASNLSMKYITASDMKIAAVENEVVVITGGSYPTKITIQQTPSLTLPALANVSSMSIPSLPTQSTKQDFARLLTSPSGAYNSDIFEYSNPEDVPDPNSIKLILFGDPTNEKAKIEDTRKGFLYDTFSNYTMVDRITDDNNADLSVFSFLNSLLDDNGFMLLPRPGTVNKNDGGILWMIMQSEFNNIGKNIEEVEFLSVNPNNANDEKKTDKETQSFGLDKGSKNRQLFDLHSNRNIVLSVQASTEHGQTTLPSIQATDQAAKQSSSMTNYKDSIFELISKQSKEINLETIGFQELNPGDNIYVNLGGELFSGRYKVVELSHKIATNFTSDIRAIRTVSGDTFNNYGKQPDVEPPEELHWYNTLINGIDDFFKEIDKITYRFKSDLENIKP